jgi:hypothetical protein
MASERAARAEASPSLNAVRLGSRRRSRRQAKQRGLFVNPSHQKYSTLPKFGFVVCVGHPGPPKGRSYVVSSAGWELRWTRAALKAELARAGRDHLVSMRDLRRRTAPKLCGAVGGVGPCPAKPLGEAGSTRGRNRVVLAVVATVKPWRRRQSRQPARCREFRRGDGGKKELGSGENTAYSLSDHRAGKAWFRLPCVSPVHCVCICSARGSLRVPVGARPSLRPFLREGVKRSTARASHAARVQTHVCDLPAK